jgi:hypothetical protein
MKKLNHSRRNSSKKIDSNLLGPCGIYCGYCLAYKKKACLGCRYQADKRLAEGVKNWCPLLNCADKRGLTECSECGKFPCMEHYDPDSDGMYTWVYIKYLRDEIKPL